MTTVSVLMYSGKKVDLEKKANVSTTRFLSELKKFVKQTPTVYYGLEVNGIVDWIHKPALKKYIRSLTGETVNTVYGPSLVGEIINDGTKEYVEMYEFGQEYYVVSLENFVPTLTL